ncbi:MAG: lipoate--protein ligase [Candidatus Bathyarchaeota archaeon]|nr:lipoate--protein ligase [Candidatus Bathyarchaeota archaeon]
MEEWRYIDLGRPEPFVAQTFYEAVAKAVSRGKSPNTLIMLNPGAPYVCVGYHQDVEKEIDSAYCKENELPIIRRGQGGGATYLDGNQVFYQIIAKNSEAVPKQVDEMFRRLLTVTVESYHRLGVTSAAYKPLNDVVANGKKISGNGASHHEEASILVGNFIIDMDFDRMARVLKVPDEKFRDKMAKSMRDWVTTLKRELPEPPSSERIREVYIDEFQRSLDVKLTKTQPSSEEWRLFNEELRPIYSSHEWIYMEAPYSTRKPGRAVKIAHDIKVVEVDHKAGKLIRIRTETRGDEILDIKITGDFFATPKEEIFRLEEKLQGVHLEEEQLRNVINGFIKETSVEIPGITSDDLTQAILKVKALL